MRIWSAGCATGEEAYTIAMIVTEGLEYRRAWDIEILATDISRRALATAEEGYYSREPLRNLPGAYLAKYMVPREGGFRVSDSIRKMINFRKFNLKDLSPDEGRKPGGSHDIIFCRNVMIYFDLPGQQHLIRSLYRCLKPGGYLFTGDTEFLHIYEHDFETVEEEGAIYYRKPGKLTFETGRE